MTRNTHAPPSDRTVSSRSRRAVLSLGAAGILSGLAGCSSITGQPATGTSRSDDGVFTDISFEGQQMVVELAEGHDVERLNLVDPKGKQFASVNVAAGANRVEFQLIEIEPGLSGFDHYPPGVYELVAERGGASRTRDIEIRPNLTITSASPHLREESEFVEGLELTLRNVGTGPSWVYDIAYPKLTNGIESSISDMPGLPQSHIKHPSTASDTILTPGDEKVFASTRDPFVFENESTCTGESIEGVVIAATPLSNNPQRKFSVKFSGGASSTNPSTGADEYYCNHASVKSVDEN